MKPNGKKSPTISRQHREKLIERGHMDSDATQEDIDRFRAASGRVMSSDEVFEEIGRKRLEIMSHQEEKARLSLEELKGNVVEVARVLVAVEQCNARVRARLDAGLITDFCARMGGRPSDELALEMAKVLKEIYSELSKPIV